MIIRANNSNEFRPVLCFDERPCFLIGDTVTGLEMKQGSPVKENNIKTAEISVISISNAFYPKGGDITLELFVLIISAIVIFVYS